MTGTIPIYWGCPSIGDFFNTKGFILVDGVTDIGEALNKLTPELYESMRPHIEENFKKSKQYILGENKIYNEYISKGLI